MAKGPAVVIIARHGARLDAADKSWHLTSPTPYDPPLTYGGWSQSKALGLRIASLLHAREQEGGLGNKSNGANADLVDLDFSQLDGSKGPKQGQDDEVPRPRRRHRIVIHTSPYLRCIQTSTGIAAGIAQFQAPASSSSKVQPPTKPRNGFHGVSPLSRYASSGPPAVQPASATEPADDLNLQVVPKKNAGPEKILLRIDAFLGEWLSPDYFEDITPPPNSTMMVAGAKADLLRRGDNIEIQHNVHNTKGHFPGGWAKSNGASSIPNRSITQDSGFPTMGSLAHALPLRERASSQGSAANHTLRTTYRSGSPLSMPHKTPSNIYNSPVPSYAVSPADPIPRGYVNHAREACVNVDFQWDSMRAPQEWGDGGEYGDEWSTMHKRFRRGLGGVMTWYKEHGIDGQTNKIVGSTYHERGDVPGAHHAPSDPFPLAEATLEEDEDLVLILVTHGAGCNALLGAISNQPILLDVGMASLSMAVRRDEPQQMSSSPTNTVRRPSIMDMGMSSSYEMKMLASVDHLRPGVDPSKPPQAQSPVVLSSPSIENRRRFTATSNSLSNPMDSPFTLGEPYRAVPSSLGSLRRSSTSGSSSRLLSSHGSSASVGSTPGLWSAARSPATQAEQAFATPTLSPLPTSTIGDGGHSPGHDMVLNFQSQKPKLDTLDTNVNGNASSDHGEDDDVPPLPSGLGKSLSQGLWGGTPKSTTSENGLWGPPAGGLNGEVGGRTMGPKRRWTVTERDA